MSGIFFVSTYFDSISVFSVLKFRIHSDIVEFGSLLIRCFQFGSYSILFVGLIRLGLPAHMIIISLFIKSLMQIHIECCLFSQ